MRSAFFALAILCLPVASRAASASRLCDQALASRIPARPTSAPAARALLRSVEGLGSDEREAAFRAELLAGNIPSFLRKLVPVALAAPLGNGRTARVTVCVSPDYLALGSDDDYLLVPLRLGTALEFSRRFGFTLPTTKVVDAIYRQAEVRLRPRPLPPGSAMRSTQYYHLHSDLIRRQRLAMRARLGALTAGHKKDLVLTNRLLVYPQRVAIYGWHRGERRPIQPLSTVHGDRYADYSHGVRLVSTTAFVDGRPTSIFELLQDPLLSRALSDEGSLLDLARLAGAPPPDA